MFRKGEHQGQTVLLRGIRYQQGSELFFCMRFGPEQIGFAHLLSGRRTGKPAVRLIAEKYQLATAKKKRL